jgi:hypothetical protein
MNMIVHQNPGNDSGSGGFSDLTKPRKKMLTVLVIPKNIGPFDAANHHMMKRSWCIQSRLSWHNNILSQSKPAAN